jgi:opacity protein-like surface antigen
VRGSVRLLSVTLISSLSAIAFAQMAPAADVGGASSPQTNWTGVYVGAEFGYGSSRQNFVNGTSQPSPTVRPQRPGGSAGAHKQLGDSVLGVEADIHRH